MKKLKLFLYNLKKKWKALRQLKQNSSKKLNCYLLSKNIWMDMSRIAKKTLTDIDLNCLSLITMMNEIKRQINYQE